MEILKFVIENDFENFKENLDMDVIEMYDENKNTILHHCCEIGNLEFVDILLYYGADPNVKNKQGNTPVHIACSKDFSKIVEILLEFGGDLEIKNNQQRTPVNLAINNKANSVIKVIENSGIQYTNLQSGREKINHHRKLEEY